MRSIRIDNQVLSHGNWSKEIGRPEQLELAHLHKVECALCGEKREWTEFLHSPGTAMLVPFCGICRRERRDEVRRLAQKSRPEVRRRVMAILLELAKRRTEHFEGRKGVARVAEEYAAKLAKLPDRVAVIIGKTYSEIGDEFEVSDDTAVGMIRDLLYDIDPSLIEQNKNKKLSRRKPR